MKNGKKPSRELKKLLQQNDLNPADWLIVKNEPDAVTAIHRDTGAVRVIEK